MFAPEMRTAHAPDVMRHLVDEVDYPLGAADVACADPAASPSRARCDYSGACKHRHEISHPHADSRRGDFGPVLLRDFPGALHGHAETARDHDTAERAASSTASTVHSRNRAASRTRDAATEQTDRHHAAHAADIKPSGYSGPRIRYVRGEIPARSSLVDWVAEFVEHFDSFRIDDRETWIELQGAPRGYS